MFRRLLCALDQVFENRLWVLGVAMVRSRQLKVFGTTYEVARTPEYDSGRKHDTRKRSNSEVAFCSIWNRNSH